MKVLLTYGYHESGHFTAVKALEEELASRGCEFETMGIWAEKSPTIDRLFTIFRSFAAEDVKRVPDFLISQELLDNLAKEHPAKPNLTDYEAVISTHPYSSFVLAEAKREQESDTVLVNVHTDYTPFPIIVHSSIDYHVGALPRDDATKLTLPKMIATGIPVRKNFHYDGTAKQQTVLVMGGADGFGKIKPILSMMEKLPQDYSYVVFCGRNIQLQNQLQQEFPQHTFASFIEDPSPYFKSAKFIITKASGLTLTEALNSECIPIFAPPILFWEDEAAKYLSTQGAGLYLPDFGEYSTQASTQLLKSEDQQALIRNRMRLLRKPNAAREIVDLIEERPRILPVYDQSGVLEIMQENQRFFAGCESMPATANYLAQQIMRWVQNYETDSRD